jgi:subtilase family serine protease
VAIVDAYNDPDAESDLATYRSRYRLSGCTTGDGCFRKVNQTGGTSYPTANASWAVEISLDLDMVSAACPNCHILLVETSSNSNDDLYTAEDEAVALGATEVSNSWGGEEEPNETSDDSYFHHTGVLITAAAGDSGYEVEYPAASQYVIGVGGTTLTQASNSRGWSETAWSGTGSGCSAYEPKPAWQTDSPLCTKRTNNDVAAVASPETPVSVADSYKLPSEFSKPEPGWTLVGGTSVSSPFIAATMALANAYTKSFPGADALYEEAAQNGTGVLDDVASGSNGSCRNYLCEAGPGYDGPTGLGSPYGAPVVSPNPPTVVTQAASAVTQTSASLNATVNPNGGEVSECKLEYGTTSSYGSSAPCASLPGSGTSATAVSASVTGLATSTTYHFRISATNPGGTSTGSDEKFTTMAAATTPPTVVTGTASSLTLPQQGPGGQEMVPGLGTLPSQEHKTPPVPDAKLASASLTVSPSGMVNVEVTCPAGESSCTGTVMLRTLNAVIAGATIHQSKKRKAAILTLASGSFRVAGGEVKTLTLRLSTEARKLLATTHLLRARATIVAHDPTGAKHSTQTIVTLRALKATSHHGMNRSEKAGGLIA